MLKDSEKSSTFHFVLVFFQTEILIYCIEIIFKNLKKHIFNHFKFLWY